MTTYAGSEMAVHIRRHGQAGACVVEYVGDIDISVVPEFRRELETALESGCSHVVMDLSRVEYADSSALGLLVWLDRRLTPLGGRLVLAGATRDVTRVLELSGLVSIARSVSATPNVEAALEGIDLTEHVTEPLWCRSISMGADVDELGVRRQEVCDLAIPLGFSEAALFDIKVAVGEALANAVRHGSTAIEDRVDIEIRAYDDRILIAVEDSGEGFNGEHSGADDPYASGGRGIMFMRALMDRVEYSTREPAGTIVTLVKHRAPMG